MFGGRASEAIRYITSACTDELSRLEANGSKTSKSRQRPRVQLDFIVLVYSRIVDEKKNGPTPSCSSKKTGTISLQCGLTRD